MLKRTVIYLFFGACAGLVLAAGLYAWLIIFDPGEAIRQDSIKDILAVESPVYYNDGKAKIGVFFEKTHRQYVPYEQIPLHFVDAIVAAEDHDFFDHIGIDILGMFRAMAANIRAGRVVQGGSTITQQAAKNLFKRKSRSIKSKLKELLYALRLEYHYPKTKILEFYSNQFYVSGNGRGLGVASRYYFDKPVTELNLLECAFIAGSVKSPNSYNPFTKRDDMAAAKARVLAKRRTGYVLSQLYGMGKISVEEYQDCIEKEIPFRQGKMSYSLNTVMDMVKDALDTPDVQAALQEHGIDNIATSGVRIVTSIEKDLQEQSVLALQKELSRLDIRMRGFDRKTVQEEYGELGDERGSGDIVRGALLFGRIVEVEKNIGEVTVSFDGSDIVGKIDRTGLMPVANALARYEHNRWSEAGDADVRYLLNQLEVDDQVFVRVRAIDSMGGACILDLAKYPKLQGAVMVMKDGAIRAMVGGFENHFFNRAISAKRPMGSVMKPLVYCAALQLGWNSIDSLDNRRDVFSFQNQAYFPRPDHDSPYPSVSMSWAGVHSENLATVWLLYHLCDRLLPAQFKELAAHLGMAKGDGESYQYFMQRIRDEHGVVVDQDVLRQVAFEQGVARLGPDLLFDGRVDEYNFLREMHYGLGFDAFLEKAENDVFGDFEDEDGLENDANIEVTELFDDELAGDQELQEAKQIKSIEDIDPKVLEELDRRREMLSKNYLRYLRLRNELRELRVKSESAEEEPVVDAIPEMETLLTEPEFPEAVFGEGGLPEEGLESEDAPEEILPEGVLVRNEIGDVFRYGVMPTTGTWVPVEESWLRERISTLEPAIRDKFWQGVQIEGRLAVSTLDQLRAVIDQEYASLLEIPPYEPEVLHQVRDFRVMVALRYVIALCQELGIESNLDPVLSFPLGSNVISLFEVARVYEAMATGDTYRSEDGEIGEATAIIDRVENSDGEIIFQPNRQRRKAVAPVTSIAVSDIMHNVVRFGTGRYADDNLYLRSSDPAKARQLAELHLKWPVVGKTGTANRYTNATFAGVVPSNEGTRNYVSLKNGYVVATYVGFDDNMPMVRTTTHLTGSSGALPLWTDLVKSIILQRDYAANMDLVDFYFASKPEIKLRYDDMGQLIVPVDTRRGGFPGGGEAGDSATITTFGQKTAEEISPARFFLPFWRAGENGI